MNLYTYSLIRCVPEPRTGEFINVGAIAGSSDTDDWDVRQISNMRRASRLCSVEQLGSATRFLAWAAQTVEDAEDGGEAISASWLNELHADMRNVVQLSAPQSAAGETATDVLDVIFDRLLIDPEKVARDFIGKHTLLAELRKAYKAVMNPKSVVYEKPEVHVGDHLRSALDFSLASKQHQALQITQAWSFQKGSVEDVATEVKSWGFAMQNLRDGEAARVIAKSGEVSKVDPDVAIEVLVAPPKTPKQEEVFEEAREVFRKLDAHTYVGSAEQIGERARELVPA